MQFDFALVLLVRSQPLSTMRTMLQVLQTSCLPSTFGPIIPAADGDMNVERQASREVGLIDRLLNLLIEVPKPMKGCDGYDDCHIAALRLDVLGVFMAMCTKGFSPDTKESHGGKLLAEHKLTIGRLFRFLCDSVNLLYVYPPVEITDIPLPTSSPDDQDAAATEETQESPHSLTCRAINATVRILHHVLTTYTSLIDLPKKLAAIHGGPHKHLIGLARLAFSDQVFMEAGIESDVVDAAHEMLDGYLTFEEGESLLSLFSTPPNKSVPPERDDGDKEMEQGENKRET